MTYNQVQLFQINDCVNHYVDIEITGYKDVARLISWLGTADQCLTVILENIDLFVTVQPTYG